MRTRDLGTPLSAYYSSCSKLAFFRPFFEGSSAKLRSDLSQIRLFLDPTSQLEMSEAGNNDRPADNQTVERGEAREMAVDLSNSAVEVR